MYRGWNRRRLLGLAGGLCLGTQAVLAQAPGTLSEPALGTVAAPDAAAGTRGGVDDDALPDALRVSQDLAAGLWRPRSELTPGRAAALPRYCRGGYLDLTFPYPAGSEPDDLPVDAEGDSASYQVDGDVMLVGNVRLGQGNRTLKAARVALDHATGKGRAEGGVLLVEPGKVLQGERADLDTDSGAAALDDVQFVLLDSGFRGVADALARDDAGTLIMTRGNLTRCEPGNGSWRIGAAEIEVEQDAVFGVARHAVLRVAGVPLFYTPRIRFPVTDDRQSGWMFPNLAVADQDGMDVSVPYYLNLAPNYDATITPRFIARRGVGVETELRHLSRWQETTLAGAFLHDDDRFDGTFDRNDFDELVAAGEISGEFEPEDRWLYAIDHSGAIGNLQTFVDYTAVSDRDYFRDLGSDIGVSSQIELERSGGFQYTAGGLLLRVWAQRFQRIDENRVDPYQRLPQVDLSYAGRLPGPLEWSVDSQFVSFTRDNDDLTGIAATVGERIHVEPRVRLPLTAPWGFFTLTGGLRHTRYDLRDVPASIDRQPERNISLGSARGGLFFERRLRLFGAELVQTLEPELFYLYQESVDQSALPRFDASQLTFGFDQLFRDNRFSGIDRIGDANQLSTGLTTRFLDARSGREYLRASVGEIIFFEDREVTLNGAIGAAETQASSALAGELAANLAGNWSVTGTLVWNHHQNRTEEAAGALQYRRDNGHIVNLGYRKRLQGDINQTDISLRWPLSRHFAVTGRWNYDLDSGRTIEGFGGIEYDNCCLRLGILARRFLDSPTAQGFDDVETDDGIFLQVTFKGLAGIGNKIESVLRRGIRGYRPETATDGFDY